jgi:hypothetical protein
MARQSRSARLGVEGLERREAPSDGLINRLFGTLGLAINIPNGSPVVVTKPGHLTLAINIPDGSPVLIQKPGH